MLKGIVFAALLLSQPAFAEEPMLVESQCGSTDKIVAAIKANGGDLASAGVTGDGIFEIYTMADGSWGAFMRLGEETCLVTSGVNWAQKPLVKGRAM